MNQNNPSAQPAVINCIRCGVPMKRVRVEDWYPTNILLKQLQKIVDGANVRIYHCKQCGKVEFFR